MIASDSFLHFVLDAETGHCTDSLVSLTPEAFLWYELNRMNVGQNILFFDARENGPIQIEVFDSDSRRFLLPPQKGFLSFGKTEEEPRTIARSTYSITDTRYTEEDLLEKLISAANARNAERRTALVFTCNAFDRVCRRANANGDRQMTNLLEANRGKCAVYVRLPCDAAQMQKLMQQDLSGCALLQKVYQRFGTALDLPQEPLIGALGSMLGSQLMRFDDRLQEVRNLRLKQAISDPASVDTLEELNDQADYLALCRRHCIGLLRNAAGAECFSRVSNNQLWELLQDPQFREKLRSKTAKLRASHPAGSIRDAMLAENRLPPEPPHPVCSDELAKVALGLSLPDSCTRKAEWDTTLDQIKRDLATLWNKPRNRVSQKVALKLCKEAHGAIYRANRGTMEWEMMAEILPLLSFYARQICAPEERSEALSSVWELGSQLIEQCNYVYGSSDFDQRGGLDAVVNRGIDAGDKAIIEMLRPVVRNGIRRFDRPNLVIADITKQLIEDRNRVFEDIEKSRQTSEYLRQLEQKRQQEEEKRRKEETLTSKYTGCVDNAIGPEDDLHGPFNPSAYVEEHMSAQYDFQ